MLVAKFGCTSVGSAERFTATADVIATRLGQPLVVVVSAMSRTTSALIEGARAAADGRVELYQQVHAELESRHLATIEALLEPNGERDQLIDTIHE